MDAEKQAARRTLHGLGILITRPAHQAHALAELVEGFGGKPIRFPTIEITLSANDDTLGKSLAQLAKGAIAIFVSANAVDATFAYLQARQKRFSVDVPVLCVGGASAKALMKAGVENPIWPQERFDSEALLDLPELNDVRGKRIFIFRGDSGRALLGSTLTERGAQVEYVECYKRSRPRSDSGWLLQCWQRGEIHVVCVTSADGLRNLYDMVGEAGRAKLVATPTVVTSQRIANVCRELGFLAQPMIADTSSDEAIVAAIRAWRTTQNFL